MFLTKIIIKKKLLNNTLYYKKKKLLLYQIFLLKYCKQNFYQKTKNKNLNKITYYLKNILSLTKTNNFLYDSKTVANLSNQNKNITKNSNLISYILKVTLLQSNIILSITNFKGTPLITCSSGIVNFKGSQKTKRLALNSVFKKIKYKTKKLKNKTFALHFQGIKRNRRRLLNKIKNIFFIKNIKYFNLTAHNGCKPPKIKK